MMESQNRTVPESLGMVFNIIKISFIGMVTVTTVASRLQRASHPYPWLRT